MNIKNLKESLDYLFKAQLTPFLWSHAGEGKTSSVKQYAEEKGFKFFSFYLGTQSDLGDILGLADFTKDGNGHTIATHFAPPQWLVETIDYCNANPESGAVIFLDEFNRAPRIILNGMFSFALDKKFNTLQLPTNCHLIAAGNPPTDEYFTTDVDETALMARFVHIKLESTVSEWIEYARATHVDPNLIGFIQQQPELLAPRRSEFVLPVKPDRRAFSRFNALLAIQTPSHLITELGYGILGVERMAAYEAFLKATDSPLTGIEVLSGEKRDLLAKWCVPGDIKSSYVHISCDNLTLVIADLEKVDTLLTSEQEDHLRTFLESIPKDIAYKFVHKFAHDQSKIYVAFCKKTHQKDTLINIALSAAKAKEKK